MSYAAIAVGVSGIVAGGIEAKKSRKALKFRAPQLEDVSTLVERARSTFSQNQSSFIQDQINNQQKNFGDFFDIQQQTVQQGRSFIDQLMESDISKRLATENIRSAQGARGNTLSPAAAVQEGLAVSEAQQNNMFKALGLGQELAQFSASTPLQLQQIDFTQLLSSEIQRDRGRAGILGDAQISNINLKRDETAERMALIGRLTGTAQGAIANNQSQQPSQPVTNVNVNSAGQTYGTGAGTAPIFDVRGGTGNGSAFNNPNTFQFGAGTTANGAGSSGFTDKDFNDIFPGY